MLGCFGIFIVHTFCFDVSSPGSHPSIERRTNTLHLALSNSLMSKEQCTFIYCVGGHNHEVLQPCRVLQGQEPLRHWGDWLHGKGIEKSKNIF